MVVFYSFKANKNYKIETKMQKTLPRQIFGELSLVELEVKPILKSINRYFYVLRGIDLITD